MRKSILLAIICSTFICAQARTVDVTADYTGASHFNQVQVGATLAPSLRTRAGVEVKGVKENGIKDPIFSLAVPLCLEFELLRLSLRPFYYFENKSHETAFQNAGAFGLNTQVRMTLKEDEINDIYTHAFLGASFARQKGTVFYHADPAQNRYYNETAYAMGLSQTLFNSFGFDLEGAVFQYPDGVSKVAGLRSIMNQQELASTQTLDVVHELPKYTLGARVTRLWAENNSSFFISYRYGEYHTAEPEHSVIVGNSFMALKNLSVDLAYNHVRTVHNRDRRDIGYIRLSTYF